MFDVFQLFFVVTSVGLSFSELGSLVLRTVRLLGPTMSDNTFVLHPPPTERGDTRVLE